MAALRAPTMAAMIQPTCPIVTLTRSAAIPALARAKGKANSEWVSLTMRPYVTAALRAPRRPGSVIGKVIAGEFGDVVDQMVGASQAVELAQAGQFGGAHVMVDVVREVPLVVVG